MTTTRGLLSRMDSHGIQAAGGRAELAAGARLLLATLASAPLLAFMGASLTTVPPAAAQSPIPPLTELVAAPGGAPGSVELRWQTPLFEPDSAGGARVECSYDFRYGSAYITEQGFASCPALSVDPSAVVWVGLLDVHLDLNVMAVSSNTWPAYTVSWDHALLRAWLYVGSNSPVLYSAVGKGLRDEAIKFTITKDANPQWSISRTVYTDDYGYAEWQTDDICDNPSGEWFTFKAKWDQHAVELRNGMVVQAAEGAEDSYRMLLYDDTDVVSVPNNMDEGGGELAWDEDSWVTAFFPAHAVEEDCEIAYSEPMSIPPPQGMLPGVPGAMVAFEISKSTGPELLLPVQIQVQYPPEKLMEYGGVAECALEAYRYVEGRGVWVHIPQRCGINRADHAVTFETMTLGLFAIAGETDGDHDGGGDLQELAWGTSPELADTDDDGLLDGDELWWSGGDPSDPLTVHGSDQQGSGEGLVSQPQYWIAGRIVAGRAASPISTCAYIGPPIDVSYSDDWYGPPLWKSDSAWGDFDGDGDLDLAICGESGGVPITQTYENTLSGLTLRQSLTGVQNESSGGLAWGDYDRDGDLDLAVAGMGSTQPFAGIYENDGAGNLTLDAAQSLTAVAYASLAWADFDEDLDADLFVMGHDGTQASAILYRNDPPGTLAPDTVSVLSGLYAGSADWGDLDNDGDLDLLTTGGDGTQRRTIFYKNHPTGKLTADGSHGLPAVSLSDAAWGDIDRDGDADLAFTGEESVQGRYARVYRNDKGTLTQLANMPGIYRSSCALGDMDLDGDMDVAFCGYDGGGLMTYLFENGEEGFDLFPLEFPGVREGSMQFVDVDLDGDLDFFLTGADWGSGYSVLYRHEGIAAGVDAGPGVPARPAKARVWVMAPGLAGGEVALRYSLAGDGPVRLAVYDVAGRCVRTLVEGPVAGGVHEAVWDGRLASGADAGAGVFFYRLEGDGRVAGGRLVSVR